MARRFEELDWQETPMGSISLRRRVEPVLGVDVYEVKLGEEFLMSSLFTVAEIELARIGLGRAVGGRSTSWSVVWDSATRPWPRLRIHGCGRSRSSRR